MSNLNFDLNIYNYTKPELLQLINIENNYNIDILQNKILSLEKNIFTLQLSNREKKEIILFLKMMEIILKHDLEKKEMLYRQNDMKKEISLLKGKINKMKET